MTHARIHYRAITILAVASALAPALTTATAPASARTFNLNSVGSMIQQPLPPRCGCVSLRATNKAHKFHRSNVYFHTDHGV
jgi:hypothetical protein